MFDSPAIMDEWLNEPIGHIQCQGSPGQAFCLTVTVHQSILRLQIDTKLSKRNTKQQQQRHKNRPEEKKKYHKEAYNDYKVRRSDWWHKTTTDTEK